MMMMVNGVPSPQAIGCLRHLPASEVALQDGTEEKVIQQDAGDCHHGLPGNGCCFECKDFSTVLPISFLPGDEASSKGGLHHKL